MKEDQRERIIKRHSHSIWMYGHTPHALYLENREVQEVRYKVLLDCGIQEGDSVLDVGCGFADFYRYMKARELHVNYTGIDISPDMIEAAQAKELDLKFSAGDLFDFDPATKSYDWVLLSGSLNEPLKDNGDYVRAMIPRLYESCRKGLAFNLLDANYDWSEQQLYSLQPYLPSEVMKQLETLSKYTQLRTNYLDNDATYYAWREERFRPSEFE